VTSTTEKVVRNAASEYLREASVLVGVFGLLDYLLKRDAAAVLPWWWIPLALAFSAVLFAGGVYFALKAESED
jgi:hypothetical protein